MPYQSRPSPEPAASYQLSLRARYEQEADISPATASNDFRRLLDAGLVAQEGRGRSTRYFASQALRKQVKAATG